MVRTALPQPEILERLDQLREDNQPYLRDRTRIRAIMNGGQSGIVALLGAGVEVPQNDMPVVHLLDSGLTRLAQKLRHRPDVKVDQRDDRDSARERDRAAKRERIVEGYDYNSRLELDLPQIARWLPGYGFGIWVVTERRETDGTYYPHAELRDPYITYPGYFGVNQQPEEIATVRTVPARKLRRLYPAFGTAYDNYVTTTKGRIVNAAEGPSWTGNPTDAAELAEYIDITGTYLIAPQVGLTLDHIPNPLDGVPFVVPHRYSFDTLISQYHHVIGLMAMMAKLNVLSIIAAEDAVFRETNIIGELESGEYQKGRASVNFFSPGTRIEKASVDNNYQVFQQIDRLERQLRVGTNYSVIDDAQSPSSFITGQGTDRLQAAGDANVSEYQLSLRHALEMLDEKRLEWDEKMYGTTRKPLYVNIRGKAISETYQPDQDIAGNYRTRRAYGVMAGWDEPAKVVTGLQLMQGEVIDTLTMQENLYGLENIPKINARIRATKAEGSLFALLQQKALPSPNQPEGDPKATLALVEIYQQPDQMPEILAKYFTPDEPEMSPEEQMFLQQALAGQMGGGGGGQIPGQQPPDVTTVLSRLEGSGAAEGGVQTVGRL